MRRSRFYLFIGLIIMAVVVFLIIDGKIGLGKVNTKDKEEVSFGVIDEAYTIIQKKGVYPVKGDKLIEGALRGMADVIGDPYSRYLTKEEAAAHKESLSGERIGIGAEITRSNGKFIIVAPVKGSPADKAGLRPYDEIVRIDGKRVDQDTLQDVIQRIRGKKGSAMTMTIYRPDLNKHLELSIIRDIISVKTVSSEMFEGSQERKVGYISITTFGSESAKEWELATSQLMSEGAQALIIDVRGNPGGYLLAVGEIAGSILQKNAVFTIMEDATGKLTPLHVEVSEKYKFDDKLKRVPIVLLQDKGSASASEVLSGAIQDLRRGFIAGTTSFGKGTVQETIDLSNGGEVKLSTSKWLTPKKKWIHGRGIEADLVVKQDELFQEHMRLIITEYKEGDFHDDVAYGQRLLSGLGYTVGREDGYFDESTSKAVHAFRVDAKIAADHKMDKAFYNVLNQKVETYRGNRGNDKQLQMALDYILHVLAN